MSTKSTLRSITRLVDLLSDQQSINGIADNVYSMNVQEDTRTMSRLYDAGVSLIGEFPYVGRVVMNHACAELLRGYSGVYCDVWEIYYGASLRQPVMLDNTTTNGFSCFDGNSFAMLFFRNCNEVRAVSIDVFDKVFRINAVDPVYRYKIFIQFVKKNEFF